MALLASRIRNAFETKFAAANSAFNALSAGDRDPILDAMEAMAEAVVEEIQANAVVTVNVSDTGHNELGATTTGTVA